VIDYCVRGVNNGDCRCKWNSGHACAWGVARTLWGLAAIPQALRGLAVKPEAAKWPLAREQSR
jgi:hypothetical protein